MNEKKFSGVNLRSFMLKKTKEAKTNSMTDITDTNHLTFNALHKALNFSMTICRPN